MWKWLIFIWKVEIWLEPNLVYWYNMGTFIWSCSQRSYTKVKDHLRSHYTVGWKCKIHLIWKIEVWLEPNLVYWYNWYNWYNCGNLHMFRRSEVILYTKVKGHLRSDCMAENLKLISLEKMKSDWNQTWFMDVIWELLYVHEVKGHKSRSKVIWGQPVR